MDRLGTLKNLNREAGIRSYVDGSVVALVQDMISMLKQFEEKLVECLQRHDKWKTELERLRCTSLVALPSTLSHTAVTLHLPHSHSSIAQASLDVPVTTYTLTLFHKHLLL